MKAIKHLICSVALTGFMGTLAHAQCDSACSNPGPNLLSNPDFELGNTGFTSAYNFSTAASDGNYGITQNTNLYVASQWCNNYDHTSGSGNYMWIDGSTIGSIVIWSQSVTVTPNTDYTFSFWGMDLSIPYSGGTSEFVDVYINGVLVESNVEFNSADCFWIQKCFAWNSATATTAVIEIKNTFTHFMGNDFGFDDFSFKACNQNMPCDNPGANLVLNPDFELGNVDFTSDHTFSTAASDGNYGITQNANLYVASQWCNNYDHTSGSGNFLWVDGSTAMPQSIWEQTIAVTPGTDYNFSFWGMNLSVPYSGGTMEFVDVYINGALVEGGIELNSADCFWVQKSVSWNSGTSSSALVEIRTVNIHYMGNDLGFDDISFTSCGASSCSFTCNSPGANLLNNPDFESGNIGFASDYVFSTTASQGNYGITQNANLYVASQWCNGYDHTSGSGNYLWIDGSWVQQTIWRETVSVVPNTDYGFSFWGMNLSVPYSGGVMENVDVFINGNLVAGNLSLNEADCFWVQNCTSWNSGAETSATIEVRNTNTHFMGNDLGFDDFSFMSCGAATGINENNTIEISVYPNPSNDYVTVEAYGATMLTVEMLDLAGNAVTQKMNVNSTQKIDVSNLAQGVYLVKITGENKISKTIKIQVMH